MRQGLAIVTCLFLGIVLASGVPPPATADTALGTSTWSLELATDIGSGDNDASFAIRRHSGASSAFRFRVDVSANKQDGDGTRTDTGNPDTKSNLDQENHAYAFSIQWMRFAAIRDNVTATFALGPIVQKQRYGVRQENNEGLPSFNGYEQRQETTSFGVDLGLGMEWFFNRRLSLGGQSGLRATTGSGHYVNINRSGNGATYSKDETDIDVDVTEFTTATARIQLTAYF